MTSPDSHFPMAISWEWKWNLANLNANGNYRTGMGGNVTLCCFISVANWQSFELCS